MFSRKRFLAGASAVAVAAGTTLAGAGLASAQDDTGGLSSAALGDIGGQLETAAEALNGPVSISPNSEGGPTITYANETDAAQNCLGFTAPYSTIVEDDLDTNYDPDDIFAALALIGALEDGGAVSMFGGDEDGEPMAFADPNPDEGGDVVDFVAGFALAGDGESVEVPAGEEVAWTTPTPDSPAIAIVLCHPADDVDMQTYTGIDPQVVADQMNDILPGGSIGAGSISGGSVEMGANLLGSLGDIGDDNGGEDNGGDDTNGDD